VEFVSDSVPRALRIPKAPNAKASTPAANPHNPAAMGV
jgi:hypothetical protein